MKTCETCQYKHINRDENLHCYMFKEEPNDKCMQWKGVNVGTVGHSNYHNKSILISASLSLALTIQDKNIK